MVRINFNEERIPRQQKILDHVIATVNLFNNEPRAVKKEYKDPHYFIVFESYDRRGNIRELAYNCFSEDMQLRTAEAIAEHYGIQIEE